MSESKWFWLFERKFQNYIYLTVLALISCFSTINLPAQAQTLKLTEVDIQQIKADIEEIIRKCPRGLGPDKIWSL